MTISTSKIAVCWAAGFPVKFKQQFQRKTEFQNVTIQYFFVDVKNK